jgi:MFS family permease
MLILSIIALGFTRESPHVLAVPIDQQPPIWDSIVSILRRDHNFGWFLVGRTLVQFGTMAFAFYTVFATTRLQAGEYIVGVLTGVLLITQVVANMGLGWLADHWSRKRVLEIGAVSIFFSAIIARYAPSVEWLYPAIILAGLANTAFWTVSMAYVLQFGKEHERPTYVGMANTLVAPATIIAPLLGGWLADVSDYPATFLLAAVAALGSVFIFHFFVRDPKREIPPLSPEAV